MELYKLYNIDELTPKMILTLVRRFKKNELPRIEKLQNYYRGETDILKRTFTDRAKPNNKIVNNFSSQIVDNETGYFMGKPISYHSTDKELLSELQFIFDRNHEQAHNTQVAIDASISGIGYELLYLNENGHLRFTHLDPINTFCVFDNTVDNNVIGAIRMIDIEPYISTNKTRTFLEVYTAETITTYEMSTYNSLILLEEKEHPFKEVPVIPYFNNEDGQGSFEKVMSLIDAYDLAVSDTSNDISYFSDSYMVIKGLELQDESQLREMKQNKMIQFTNPEGSVEWLTKSDSNVSVEEYKDRLKEDIVLFSGVPDLQSESFGSNLSGIAIQFKMQPLEQKVAVKQNYFTQSLDKRIKMITNFLNVARINSIAYDYTAISYKFTRNIPVNLMEYGQAAINLKGILSDETIVGMMPFISDVQEELDKIRAQYKDSLGDYQAYESEMASELPSENEK